MKRLSASRLWLAPVLVALSGAATGAAASQIRAPQMNEVSAEADAALATLRDSAATPAQRQGAARVLIGLVESMTVRTALADLLAGPLVVGGGGDHFLAAVASESDPPARLFPLLAQRLSNASPDEVPRLLAALGSFRTRDAVKLIGRYLAEGSPKPAATTAMSSLARLSARDDLGTDRAAWLAWLRDVDGLNESQWRLQLVGSLAARGDRLEAERDDAVVQLTDSLRKLHLATAAEERPALLASLLEDDIPAVRNLGFELVSRELSATGHIDGPVGDAALKLLSHPQAQVRANAAVLVRQLAPPEAEKAVAEALAHETDPVAAADLLLAAARWPSPAVVTPVLHWINSRTIAADSATEAAWWLFRAGDLGPGPSEQVLSAVRSMPNDSLIPAAASLLATLGDDNDRLRLVPLLTSPSASLRQAAGESLVWYPQYRKDIISAASSDPDLFDLASRAILLHQPTGAGLRTLLGLPRPAPEVAQAAILRLARAVPADELRAVCLECQDVAMRRALLANLTSRERVMSEKADPEKLAAICAGVTDLAELELSAGRPEAALATLDANGFAEDVADPARLQALRCTSELAVGRVEAAEKSQAPVEAWIRGLEMAKGTAAAERVLGSLDAHFGTTLTEEQKARVDAVRATIKVEDKATVVGPPSPGPASGG
jgi:hypothetical protein